MIADVINLEGQLLRKGVLKTQIPQDDIRSAEIAINSQDTTGAGVRTEAVAALGRVALKERHRRAVVLPICGESRTRSTRDRDRTVRDVARSWSGNSVLHNRGSRRD